MESFGQIRLIAMCSDVFKGKSILLNHLKIGSYFTGIADHLWVHFEGNPSDSGREF